MGARKPFTKRERAKLTQYGFGKRPTNNWGAGDLPAPWAEGDVVELTGEPNDRIDHMDDSQFYVVSYACSIDEGDAWYFRVSDGHGAVSDRLHVAWPSRCSAHWTNLQRSYMAPFTLVESADPEGLLIRRQMLLDGWGMP